MRGAPGGMFEGANTGALGAGVLDPAPHAGFVGEAARLKGEGDGGCIDGTR
jgi:hypothetical protein